MSSIRPVFGSRRNERRMVVDPVPMNPLRPSGMNTKLSARELDSLKSGRVESLPLPEQNKPPNFTGAVGDFTVTATAGPA
jgi:hypothetical protein